VPVPNAHLPRHWRRRSAAGTVQCSHERQVPGRRRPVIVTSPVAPWGVPGKSRPPGQHTAGGAPDRPEQ